MPTPPRKASPKWHRTRASGEDVSLDDESEYRWLVRVWILVALFAMVTAGWSVHVGIPVRDPHGAILRSRIALSLALFVVLALVDAGVRTGRQGWQVSKAIDVLRRRWTRRRLALAMSGLLAYHLVYFCYHNLKSWDVFNHVRDEMLLRWDRWLFLGHSPAVVLHNLLGEHVADYVLLVIYESFSSLVSVSFVAALVFTNRIRDGYVFIASALWVWILGVGTYYLIPSLGPFNSAPEDFAGLPHTMIQNTQARYMSQRAHLLAHPHASDAFAQVSAFASLHVGVTCLILLMARYYRLRRTTQALTVYLVGIMVATVYLGWHFAVDDLAGLAIAFIAVFLGRFLIYPRRRPQLRSGGRGVASV
jgi:membrane-associated phospholipid phosphatase